MTNNLFVIANVKKLRTGSSFRILLSFSQTSWCVDFLNSTVFNSFHNRVEFVTILECLLNFVVGGFEHTPTPPTPLVMRLIGPYLQVSFRYKVNAMCFILYMSLN